MRENLRDYATDLGLAFQIKDDLLDIDGDQALVGKDLGRDDSRKKATFPALMGVENARGALHRLLDSGSTRLDRLDADSQLLGELFDYVINREL